MIGRIGPPAVASPERRTPPTRRIIVVRAVGALFAVAFGLAVLLGLLAVVRYLPAVDEARALRAGLEAVSKRAAAAGIGVTRADLTAMRGDVTLAVERQDHLAGLLRDDPLIGLARALPGIGQQVRGADELIGATGDLLLASDAALSLADRYVGIREAHAGKSSTLGAIVELMASSGDDADLIVAELESAHGRVGAIPPGLVAPIEQARVQALEKIEEYLPLLAAYARADGVLADALGWSARRRYLVLAQDPAELRPTGGFIGTIGIVEFERGELASKKFQDVYNLDLKPGLPYVEPPVGLKNHLLGKFSWRLADANWSPDFPTSARDALEHYERETGDRAIDGVIALTTYAIDELLAVTGPVSVPEFDVTVKSGETTLRSLQETRAAAAPGADRKAFLDVFADRMIGRLFGLPSKDWAALVPRLQVIGRERNALAWLADPVGQDLVTEAGWDGGVRQDAGDFLYPVDSNVAPIGKLNLVTDRAFRLEIALDDVGNAHNQLHVNWTNKIRVGNSEPQVTLRRNDAPQILGMYFRLMVPERSRLEAVSGGRVVQVSNTESIESEAGRTVFANYVMVPPGKVGLKYAWVSPYPATQNDDGWAYRLTVQKQPGTRPEAIEVGIRVPDGMRIVETSPGMTVEGLTARMTGELSHDLEIVVRYSRD